MLKKHWKITMLGGLGMGYLHLAPAGHSMFQAPTFVSLIGVVGCWALIYRGISAQRSALLSALHAAWAGICYFIVTIYWVGSALVYGQEGWAALGLAAAGSLGCTVILFQWWSFAGFAAHWLTRSWSVAGPLGFATCWSVADFLCGDVVYGIPLGAMGSAVVDTPFSSLLAVIGTNGVSFLIVWLGCSLGAARLGGVVAPVSVIATVLAASLFWWPEVAETKGPATKVAAVQLGDMERHLSLDVEALVVFLAEQTIAAKEAGAELVFFPETTLLGTPDEYGIVQGLQTSLEGKGAVILGGRAVVPVEGQNMRFDVYNSAFAITPEITTRIYDKTHLAIFGEYMPWIFAVLGFDVIGGSGGLAKGQGLTEFTIGDAPPFILTICYEGLMSGPIQRAIRNAEWMVNISNEYLFGDTAGALIIQRYNRMRSIETGLPTLRATMTGYTSIIDAAGNVENIMASDVAGVLVTEIPDHVPTVFAHVGYTPLHSLQFLILMAMLILRIGTQGKNYERKQAHLTRG